MNTQLIYHAFCFENPLLFPINQISLNYPINLDYNYLQDFSLLHILILGLNCNSRKLCLMFWCKTSTRMKRESNILCTFDKSHW